MTPKKTHYALLALLVVTLAAIVATFYFGRQMLVKTSQKVVDAKLHIITANKEEDTYLSNRQILQENEYIANKLSTLIPDEKEQALAVETLTTYARNAGLPVTSIVFPGSSLDPSLKTKTKLDISQATPVKDLTNVYEIPTELGIKLNGEYLISTDQLLSVVESIESSPRNMRITSITFNTKNSEIKLSISLYVKK